MDTSQALAEAVSTTFEGMAFMDAEPDSEEDDAQPQELLEAERHPGGEYAAESHGVANDHPENDGDEDEADESVETQSVVD